MVGDFEKNRKKIQDALYESDFVERLESSSYTIIEEKNSIGSGKLRELEILNIPNSTESSYHNAWVVNLEIADSVFSAPSFKDFKTTEKAIIFYTQYSMYVIMVEMKNTLQPYSDGSIRDIEKKFRATISRLSVLLPIHIYGEEFIDIELKYIGLVVYNEDKVSSLLGRDEELARQDICKVLFGFEQNMFIKDYFGAEHSLDIHFCINPINSEEMEIDLATIFDADDWNFPNASFSTLKCPKI